MAATAEGVRLDTRTLCKLFVFLLGLFPSICFPNLASNHFLLTPFSHSDWVLVAYQVFVVPVPLLVHFTRDDSYHVVNIC